MFLYAAPYPPPPPPGYVAPKTTPIEPKKPKAPASRLDEPEPMSILGWVFFGWLLGRGSE